MSFHHIHANSFLQRFGIKGEIYLHEFNPFKTSIRSHRRSIRKLKGFAYENLYPEITEREFFGPIDADGYHASNLLIQKRHLTSINRQHLALYINAVRFRHADIVKNTLLNLSFYLQRRYGVLYNYDLLKYETFLTMRQQIKCQQEISNILDLDWTVEKTNEPLILTDRPLIVEKSSIGKVKLITLPLTPHELFIAALNKNIDREKLSNENNCTLLSRAESNFIYANAPIHVNNGFSKKTVVLAEDAVLRWKSTSSSHKQNW